jgi:hypothetical protein
MSHCPTLYLNSYHVKDTLGNIASTTAWEGISDRAATSTT